MFAKYYNQVWKDDKVIMKAHEEINLEGRHSVNEDIYHTARLVSFLQLDTLGLILLWKKFQKFCISDVIF